MLTLLLPLALAASPAPTPRTLVRAPDASVDGAGQRWALLIGVDDYEDSAFADLRYTANDARKLAGILIDSGSWRSDHVVVMTPDQPDPRLQPTRLNILKQLDRLSRLSDADTVLFFFSGHGGAAEADSGLQNMVFPMDTGTGVESETAITVEYINHVLSRSEVRRRVAIFDACRNVQQAGAKGDARKMQAESYGSGTQLIFSTRFGEVSYEDDQAELGAMTRHLVDGLRGKADGWGSSGDADGVVSLNEVYQYLHDRLPAEEHPQFPTRAGEVEGDDDFGLVRVVDETADVPCPVDDRALREAVIQASLTCASSDADFHHAWQRARSMVGCLQERADPSTAWGLHRLEGLHALRVHDTTAAMEALSAAHWTLPSLDLRAELPEDCRDRVMEEAMRHPLPDRRVSGSVPPWAQLRVNGRLSKDISEELPALVQTERDGAVYWSGYLFEHDIPVFPPKPAPGPRRRIGDALLLSSAGGLLLGIGLGAASFAIEDRLDADMSALPYEHPTSRQVDEWERRKNLSNATAYAAQATIGIAAGTASAGVTILVGAKRAKARESAAD